MRLPRGALVVLVAALSSGCYSATLGARMMLVPGQSRAGDAPALRHRPVTIAGDGVTLEGWLFPAESARGTIIFLHGRNQNRSEGLRVAERLVPLGWDVLVYDSRAHGASGGEYSTFGYWERRDLSRVIDSLGAERIVVMGVSLGGAVAIQGAADDPRIDEVISISAFSSMRRVVRERLPAFIARLVLSSTFRAAEEMGAMRVDGADTAAAARRVTVPTLVLHGEDDRFVPREHARQIHDALAGPKSLVLVPGAGHGNVLQTEEAWRKIVGWLEGSSPRVARRPGGSDR
ncbi:MAG TPA: alpha/beta fold hydrolase [Anaeromyxobacter sp.]|nr:alpha/beta fold hydrolase [Anaeromyxobacter sp.]